MFRRHSPKYQDLESCLPKGVLEISAAGKQMAIRALQPNQLAKKKHATMMITKVGTQSLART